MKENAFQAKLIDKLRRRNCRVVNFVGAKMQESGIADLRVTHTNWKGWIELKVDGNDLTTKQHHFLLQHAERGDSSLAVWLMNEDGRIVVRTFPQCVDTTLPNMDKFVEVLLRRRNG